MLPFITVAIAAIKTAVAAVTTALPQIGAAVMNLVNKIPQNLWKPLIELATEVAKCIFGVKDNAAEIGEKARVAAEQGIKPEQFSSTAEYLKHLREKIEIDREKFNSLSEEEIRARELTGAAIFIRGIEEKIGSSLSTDCLAMLSRIAMPASQILILAEKLKNSNLTFDDVVCYFKNECPSSKIPQVGGAIKDAVQEFLGANASKDEVNQTIRGMMEKNRN